jgi:ketosteroid isomerase-like protein
MSEQSVEVVKRAYAAFAAGNVPGVLGVFADDFEWA